MVWWEIKVFVVDVVCVFCKVMIVNVVLVVNFRIKILYVL